MLGSDEVDTVVIATSNFLHAENSIAAAEAGKHILCEKPLEEIPEMMRQSYYPSWDGEISDKWASRLPGGKWIIISPPRDNPYNKQIDHFCDCILRDKEPRTNVEDRAKSVEVALAAVRSMETRTWVDLPLKEEVVPPGYRPT